MSDSVVFIRNLVVDAIRESALTPQLPIIAIYDAELDLKTLKGGRLIVVPQGLDPRLASRGGAQKKSCNINLAVQYKYAKPTPEELDPYLSLAESFSDYFLGYKFKTPVPNTNQFRDVGVCLETALPHGLWFTDHIAKFRVLTSVIALNITYST